MGGTVAVSNNSTLYLGGDSTCPTGTTTVYNEYEYVREYCMALRAEASYTANFGIRSSYKAPIKKTPGQKKNRVSKAKHTKAPIGRRKRNK